MSAQASLWRIVVVVLVFLAFPAAAALPAGVREAYGKLPLHFEANRGQIHKDVRFISRGPGYSVYLTEREAVLALPRPSDRDSRSALPSDTRIQSSPVVLRMSLAGAAAKPRVSGVEERPGKANYFIGSDPANWRTNVPTYGKVQYGEVYPGIELVFYGNQRQLEYDFIVAPGADPKTIRLDVKGVDKLEIDAQGDLVMHSGAEAVRQRKPVIYQTIDGTRREVAGRYVLRGKQRIGFQVAAYDKSRPLVIDPVLLYSTYVGGSPSEDVWAIAVDNAGNAYVAGSTMSTSFPTSSTAFQPISNGGGFDAYVAKLDASGSSLVYATYLGGSNGDFVVGLAVDAQGNAYVSGGTGSSNFPTTIGAFQTSLPVGGHAFVTKLNATGSALIYSTYLGGTRGEGGLIRIAVDSLGNAYVVGHTTSSDFPTTPGAFQTTWAGNMTTFVTKINPTGSALVYSTYLGNSNATFFKQENLAVAVDSAGNAYVAGGTTSSSFPTTAGAFQTAFGGGRDDVFVTKLDPSGSALVYSTYIGGSTYEQAWAIALDGAGNVYVTGETDSADFPISAGAFQTAPAGFSHGFVTKLNATGSALSYSTYLGGNSLDYGLGVAVDGFGNAYVTGGTFSTDFPTTSDALQRGLRGFVNAFITKLSADASSLLYSTYLGGNDFDEGRGIAVDVAANIYVVGLASSTDFPTTEGAFQRSQGGAQNAFVAKLGAAAPPPPPPSVGAVTGGGSIGVTGDIGTFGFTVQRAAADAPILGDLQYVHHASGANVHSVTFTSFVIAGKTATFGGSCTKDGVPCTFTVKVTDNGEPGSSDSFEINVVGGPTAGAGSTLRSGNIQIQPPSQ